MSSDAETQVRAEGTLPSAGVASDSKVQIGTAETLPPPPMPPSGAERYVLVRELGRGGMGRVDEVFDATLGRAVARKASLVVASDVRAKMLIAEAQTCAQLEHPSIVPVYDAGTDVDGQPFYTMRNVRGRTLGDVLLDKHDPTREPKTLAQLLSILRQVCLAVDYAHSRGVVHRDLKPDNVIVGEFGEVYVLDWGIAHVMGGSDVRRTELEDFVAGSPGYIAPEQAMGSAVDGRADVFALGAILHEILTGTTPFDDADFRSVRARASQRLSMPPSRRSPGVHPSFDALVSTCLEPDPKHRLASARLIADAIDVYLDSERERAERERDARRCTDEGFAARDAFVSLAAEREELEREAEIELAALAPWEPAARKQTAWEMLALARSVAAQAAHARARAEAAFSRALARVDGFPPARKGLAELYYREFEEAEARGEPERMVQYLDLARTYDDGALQLELSDKGEIEVFPDSDCALSLARYEPTGSRFVLGEERSLGADASHRAMVDSGSYLVIARRGEHTFRYPILVRRARRHVLRLELRHRESLPADMCLVAGGPFRRLSGQDGHLPDFAIARFPVTMGQYARFLDTLAPEEQKRRAPSDGNDVLIKNAAGAWILTDYLVEGEGRKRIVGRELDVPVLPVSWYDARAYVEWLARESGLPYRLPTELEWEKALRGADARAFPMGNSIDPSFAKLRESRPEASQPEPIGAFPLDESPYGVRDLAGGVGDWTATMVDGRPPPTLTEEGTSADEREAVWRGGAWSTTASQHAPMRYTQMLRHRVGWVGFRVALTLDGPSSDLVVEPMRR